MNQIIAQRPTTVPIRHLRSDEVLEATNEWLFRRRETCRKIIATFSEKGIDAFPVNDPAQIAEYGVQLAMVEAVIQQRKDGGTWTFAE